MKTFGRYLTYRLENTALRTVTLAVLSIILVLSSVSSCISDTIQVEFRETGIYMLALLLGVLCTVVPMLETACFKNRRNLDTLYFFPLKRWKMALAHYLSGLIQVLAIYTVAFVTAHVYLAVKTDYFALYHLFAYYFASVAIGIVMYSFFIFIFGEANTETDGVVFSVMWIFAIFVSMLALSMCLSNLISEKGNAFTEFIGNMATWGLPYAPINNLTEIFQDMIEINRESSYHAFNAEKYLRQWYMFPVWGGIGLASAVGYFFTFVRKEAHKAGEISDSIFGYRLLIPLYGYSLLLMVGTIDILTVPIFGAMLIGYIIYRRGVKLKASDLVVTACGLLALLVGAWISG